MGLAFVGNIYPVPAAPFSYLPYIYLALLLGGVLYSIASNYRGRPLIEELSSELDPIAE